MKKILFIVFFLLFYPAHAEMYKWVDENGEIIYSDEPPHENATPLNPPPLTTTPAIKYKPEAKPEIKDDKKATSYSVFKITSPGNDQVVRDNSGNITVKLAIEPALDTKEGHTITLLVDSQSKIQGSTGLTLGLKNIDRGSHSIQAVIKNKQRKIIKSSNSITVHMRRFSKLHKPAP